MFEGLGFKKENSEKKMSNIIMELGSLLHTTAEDSSVLASGEKLKLPLGDNGRTKELIQEGRKLSETDEVGEETKKSFKDILEAIEGLYDL